VIRVDNGPPFASYGLGRLSSLSVWWIEQGIEVEFTRPAHPQDNGSHERMHRDLKAEATQPPRPIRRRNNGGSSAGVTSTITNARTRRWA